MLTKEECNQIWPSLRHGQTEAITAANEYLAKPYTGKSFLACLPTGAGKTGVIAMLSQTAPMGCVLVLSPRRAVCAQLRTEIGGAFFSARGLEGPSLRPTQGIKLDVEKDVIYVETFQKLLALPSETMELLQKNCSLLIIDEGHSEPAPAWGTLVRSFNVPKIIITATPYRNDLFQFDVDDQSSYCYSFSAALDHDVIVEPEFVDAAHDEIVQYVKDWASGNPGLKIIVKCNNLADVVTYKDQFALSGLKTIAIHDRLKNELAHGTYSQVPGELKGSEVEIIVHQRKLDEGVDLPEAKLLVLTYPISSGRELVQTVGRIVRKHPGVNPSVLDCAAGSNRSLWRNYRKFDAYIGAPDGWRKFLKSLDTARLIESYLSVFPDYTYFGSGFREKFDFATFNPVDELQLPTASVCFLKTKPGFSIEAFMDTLLWRFFQRGELARQITSEFGFRIIISISYENSRFLKDKLFFEPTLHFVVAKKIDGLVALYDSRSTNYGGDKELLTGAPIDLSRLLKLSGLGHASRVRETHARAVSTTGRRAERISQGGIDLNEVAASQALSAYALSITKVDNVDQLGKVESSFYLSAGSGRVSDQKERKFGLERLSEWIFDIEEAFRSAPVSTSVALGNYALSMDSPPGSLPLSLTFDLSELDAVIDLVSGAQQNKGTEGIKPCRPASGYESPTPGRLS